MSDLCPECGGPAHGPHAASETTRISAVVGRKLLEIRREKRLTQTQVETMTDISQGTVSMIERGKQEATPEQLGRIERAFPGLVIDAIKETP